MEGGDEKLKDRLTRQGEDAVGRLAEDLVANTMINDALSKIFEARHTAARAQETAMGALGIPSAADIERLTRRLRSVSQRLEGIEDGLDRLEYSLGDTPPGAPNSSASTDGDARTAAIEARLDEIARDLAALREAVAPGTEAPPRSQERLTVNDSD